MQESRQWDRRASVNAPRAGRSTARGTRTSAPRHRSPSRCAVGSRPTPQTCRSASLRASTVHCILRTLYTRFRLPLTPIRFCFSPASVMNSTVLDNCSVQYTAHYPLLKFCHSDPRGLCTRTLVPPPRAALEALRDRPFSCALPLTLRFIIGLGYIFAID